MKIGNNQYNKLVAKGREEYFSKIRPTLEQPILIIQNRTNELLFIKSFDDNKGLIFNSVVINKFDINISISSHPIRENNIVNKLMKGAIVIRTSADNIFKAGINFSRQTTTAGHDKSLIPYSLSKGSNGSIISQNILKIEEGLNRDLEISVLRLGEVLEDNKKFRFDPEYFKKEYLAEINRLKKFGYTNIDNMAFVTDGIHESIDFDSSSNINLISAKSPKENIFDLSSTLPTN